MNELRRFLRYVSPGLAYTVLTMLYLLLTSVIDFEDLRTDNEGLKLIFGGLVVATGGGHLIASIHHLCYWTLYPYLSLTVNQRETLRRAVNRRILLLRRTEDGAALRAADIETISLRGAWVIVNSIWHSHERDNALQKATHRITTVFDILHSAGALLMASFLAFVTLVLVLVLRCDTPPANATSASAFLIGFIVILLSIANLHQVRRTAESMVDAVFASFLADVAKSGTPICFELTLDNNLTRSRKSP